MSRAMSSTLSKMEKTPTPNKRDLRELCEEGSDLVIFRPYIIRHGTRADHKSDHYDLGFPGAVGHALSAGPLPPGCGWRGASFP